MGHGHRTGAIQEGTTIAVVKNYAVHGVRMVDNTAELVYMSRECITLALRYTPWPPVCQRRHERHLPR